MKKKIIAFGMAALLLFASGCTSPVKIGPRPDDEETVQDEELQDEVTEEESVQEEPEEEETSEDETELGGIVEEDDLNGADADEDSAPEDIVEEEPEEEIRGLIVIDPGHQSQGDSDTEPNGPGSSEMKAKVSSGTAGVSTGKPEYELNLEVSLKLRDELENRGYDVIMTRETHDVKISNAERAQIANDADADVFVRIHANGSDDQSVNGVITICQTASNPYNANLYSENHLLSELILDAVVESTGANRQYIWETDEMTGINWCEVPSTIVEMGFMTNPEEDERMATDEYQYKIVEGIANGIDEFMTEEGK